MKSVEHLTTERLIARRTTLDDLDEMRRLYADERVTATLGGPPTEQQLREQLSAAIAHWEKYGFGIWMLRTRADDRFVGRAGLRHVTLDGADEIELLYAIAFEFWNRGYVSEIASELVRVAFESLGMASVMAVTLPTNLASRRVMEHAGLRYERDVVWAGLPHVLYRISRGRG